MEGRRDSGELFANGMLYFQETRYEEAEKVFKNIMEEHPLSPYAIESQLMLGDVCFAGEKYDDASSYYTSFVALHPAHPRASYALFQKGMSHFKDILTIDRDQTATKKSLFAFEDLVFAYPDSPYTSKAKELIGFLRRRLAEREFYVGNFYFKGKNYKGALLRFKQVLEKYPEVGLTDKTLFYIGESYVRLGENELAKETFEILVTQFPESPFAKDAIDNWGKTIL